jgi:hypothetical protein
VNMIRSLLPMCYIIYRCAFAPRQQGTLPFIVGSFFVRRQKEPTKNEKPRAVRTIIK